MRLPSGDVVENNPVYGRKVWKVGDIRPSWMDSQEGVNQFNQAEQILESKIKLNEKKDIRIFGIKIGEIG